MKFSSLLRSFLVGAALVLSGCTATVVYEPEKSDSTGIRYYESAPYLLVYSDGKGGLKWQILYLPDQSRVMTATPIVRGGKAQMALYFQNGVLGASAATGDTTAIPNAIIAAAQSAVPLLAKAVAAGQKPPGFPAPYLYKIIVNGDVVEFNGGRGDTMIRVAIPRAPPPTPAPISPAPPNPPKS